MRIAATSSSTRPLRRTNGSQRSHWRRQESHGARSIAYWAAWCVAEDDEQAPIAAAAAKSYAGDVAVLACERAIQVLGGIGFTWEHVLHRYYKRALWIQAHGGYPRELRAKVAAWLLD